MKQLNFKRYIVTYSLILVCVIVYLYTSVTYSFDMSAYDGYEAGGFMPLAIYVDREYYRFFSANFIHFGISHLLMNMFSLYNIGPFLESAYGKIRYLILILGSAICTTVLPYFYFIIVEGPYSQSSFTVSGGASGIILGLVGGLCCMAVFYKSIFSSAFKSILPSLILIVVISITVPTVSLSGHLGGFIGGFITTFILIKQKPLYMWHLKKKQDYTNRPC